MSTLPLAEPELPLAADDFAALEERVLRLVQSLRTERDARARAEQHAAGLQQRLDEQGAHLAEAQGELAKLERERDGVRSRVERLLKQLDEIAA